MGYRIAYQSMKKKTANKRFSIRLPVLTLMCFSLFLFLAETLWPDGISMAREALDFPEKVVAVSALNDLAEELQEGVSLVIAISDFCRKLLT